MKKILTLLRSLPGSAYLLIACVALYIFPAGLSAVVEIGSDYIGPGSPGMWRKASEVYSIPGPETNQITNITYYYNQVIPTRLDSLIHYSSSEYSGGFKDRYEYFSYPDYYEVVIKRWTSDSWNPVPSLYTTTTITYSLDDRIMEWKEVHDINTTHIFYQYDASLNLASETEYHYQYSITQPWSIIAHNYDTQNRLIHTQWTSQFEVVADRWQSWSSHSLPDSIFLSQTYESPSIQITKHSFDADGNLSLMSQISYNGSWHRTDNHYYYLSAHGLMFPEHTFIQRGYVGFPEAVFTPNYSGTIIYNYTGDYHNVSYSYGGENYSYNYNPNWLLTALSQYGDSGTRSRSITWHYYGPTDNEDAFAPQPQISAYPNPARHQLNFRLPKQDSQTSAEARIYNLRGQLVCSLQPSSLTATELLYNWDCRDSNQNPVPNGIYLIRIETAKGPLNRRVTVLR